MKVTKFLTLCILLLLQACTETDTSIDSWEHSLSGLYAAEFSSDGRYAVVASSAEGTRFWDIEKNSVLYQWKHGDDAESEITRVAISPDGSHVVTVDTKNFVIWDTTTGKASGYWQLPDSVLDVAISRQANFLLFALKDGRTIHINMQTQRRLETIAHAYERVNSVALTADGQIAISGGNDGRVMVWSTQTGKELHTFEHGNRINQVRLDSTEKLLFSSDEGGQANIFDITNGKLLSSLKLKERQRNISSARFSNDSKMLLTGFPGRMIALWDVSNGSLLNQWQSKKRNSGFRPSSATIYAVAFTKDKQILAESSNGIGQRWQAVN